ncbi:hypothetical protein JTP67_33985, partial [Streptomyces sp. S12]|nr:hypothetical protein [Streptomyces sp. S12]
DRSEFPLGKKIFAGLGGFAAALRLNQGSLAADAACARRLHTPWPRTVRRRRCNQRETDPPGDAQPSPRRRVAAIAM